MKRSRYPAIESLFLAALPICALISVCGGSARAAGRELVRNGDFESGDLAHWTRLYDNNGETFGSFVKWAVGANTPRSGHATAPNPQGGTSFALSDQNNVSYQVLFQKIRIPRGTRRVILTYQMFVRSGAALVFNPIAFSTMAGPNQQARVDLIKGASSNLTTTNGVVKRLYGKGADAVSPAAALPYSRYRFDLSRKVSSGRSYKIRFGTVTSAGSLNLGVDNVSVKAY